MITIDNVTEWSTEDLTRLLARGIPANIIQRGILVHIDLSHQPGVPLAKQILSALHLYDLANPVSPSFILTLPSRNRITKLITPMERLAEPDYLYLPEEIVLALETVVPTLVTTKQMWHQSVVGMTLTSSRPCTDQDRCVRMPTKPTKQEKAVVPVTVLQEQLQKAQRILAYDTAQFLRREAKFRKDEARLTKKIERLTKKIAAAGGP